MRTCHTRPRQADRAEATRPFGAAIRIVANALLVCALCPAPARAAGGASFLVDARDFAARVADTTVPFIENRGQVDPAVAFYARTFAGTVFVTRAGEIVYALPAAADPGAEAPRLARQRYNICFLTGSRGQEPAPTPILAVRETLLGAMPRPIRGLRPSDAVVNVFKGNDPKRWQSGLRVFEAVDMGEVWPGVRLELVASGDNVEKRFTVAPGASPAVIRIRVEGGAPTLRRERDGQLTVPSELGPVVFTRPVAYPPGGGRPVAVAYAVRGDVYGFRVGPYDRTQPLVIDPLLASTFIGGASSDLAYRVTVAADGDILIAGGTGSAEFPTTPGAFQETYVSAEAFVSRFSPDLRRLRASTFLGGNQLDTICGLGLDPAGNVVVAGPTNSTDFPTTPGAYDETAQRSDGFVAVLSGNLRHLLASTCMRGDDGGMYLEDLVVDADGSVLVTGTCGGTQLTCPTTPGTYDTTPQYSDALIARFSNDLTTLIAGTLVGTANQFESAHRIALDPAGNVVVVGEWFYQGRDAVPRLQSPLADGRDGLGCVAKLDPDLTTVLGGRYLGDGEIRGLSIDADGAVWIAGRTWSWPVTAGAFQPACRAWNCGFVTKLAPDMETVLASTYIGGRASTYSAEANQAVPDGTGGVFVVGQTEDRDFPTSPGAWWSVPGSICSGFVVRLDSVLSGMVASTLLGGSAADGAYDTTLGPDGSLVVIGATVSNDYPTTPGAFDRVLPYGESKILVSVFTPDLLADPQPCMHGGDLDFDGETLMDDVQAAFYAVLGLYSPLPWEYCQADCNGDDRLTAGDAQAAFAKFLGLGACADDRTR